MGGSTVFVTQQFLFVLVLVLMSVLVLVLMSVLMLVLMSVLVLVLMSVLVLVLMSVSVLVLVSVPVSVLVLAVVVFVLVFLPKTVLVLAFCTLECSFYSMHACSDSFLSSCSPFVQQHQKISRQIQVMQLCISLLRGRATYSPLSHSIAQALIANLEFKLNSFANSAFLYRI